MRVRATFRHPNLPRHAPAESSLHRRLAYGPGDVTLWPNLSGGEMIDLLGRLRGGLNRACRHELLGVLAIAEPWLLIPVALIVASLIVASLILA